MLTLSGCIYSTGSKMKIDAVQGICEQNNSVFQTRYPWTTMLLLLLMMMMMIIIIIMLTLIILKLLIISV